jgi:predicted RNA-binding Zn-ribbon protein involved in translation (DUF1610 family)
VGAAAGRGGPLSAVSTSRAQPFLCPYCGEQDLRPVGGVVYHCPDCDRRFELRFLGLGDGGTEEAGPR